MLQAYEVPSDAPDQLETTGTKAKFWYTECGRRYLFKEGRPETGENWAEVLCGWLCELIGIPHATYYFAKWKEKEGVITPTFVPSNGRLVHGNELLANVKEGYELEKKYKQRDHLLRTVLSIIKSNKSLKIPTDSSICLNTFSPISIFTGYIIFDAIVSNQDRHHQNWSFIVMSDKEVHLAPSYDHAASLGCHIRDDERRERLATKDARYAVGAYVKKAKTPFYNSTGSMFSTIDAVKYCKMVDKKGFNCWRQRLSVISIDSIKSLIWTIPDNLMTLYSKQFALKMIELNRSLILGL